MKFRIIFKDEYLVVIDKPAGIAVHPPFNYPSSGFRCVVKNLRDQLGQWVYPVHRLDQATSGVLILALSGEVAAQVQEQFKNHQIIKTYYALVRGWCEERGVVDSPLSKELGGGSVVPARTDYECTFRFELPYASSVHATSRFSIVRLRPETGRLHQIRRHLKKIAHPIIGDTVHGDGKQNQLIRNITNEKMLYLKAYSLTFSHPETKIPLSFHSRWNASWHRIFDLAGFCPF